MSDLGGLVSAHAVGLASDMTIMSLLALSA